MIFHILSSVSYLREIDNLYYVILNIPLKHIEISLEK